MTMVPATGQARLDGALLALRDRLRQVRPRPPKGKIQRALGVTIHASLRDVRLGEICELRDPASGFVVLAEVVGLQDGCAILTPIGDLDGLSAETEVVPTGEVLLAPVGPGLLGRAIDATGMALDGTGWPRGALVGFRPVHAPPPSPLARDLIEAPLQLGLRAIDGLLGCARGQRLGIFGPAGAGKSSLLADIVAGTEADVIVLALVGERGREVRETLERRLSPAARARTVAIVATSDRPALERVKAAHVATTIAEYFRDTGQHVLLLMDSVTRFARAQREIGLAAGEPPTRRGFPPSLFAVLPKLLERAGPGQGGSITGIYTVLTEGEAEIDPVAEEVMALLDGHIVLSSELAQQNHFPAIDVLKSRSRLMSTVAPPQQLADAQRMRELLTRHAEVELLVRVGEYEPGSDRLADEALARIDGIRAFLRQPSGEQDTLERTRARMREALT